MSYPTLETATAPRSISYKRVLDGVYNLYGIEEETAQTRDWRLVRDFTNNRLTDYWDIPEWPELIKTEQRTVVVDEDGEGTYVPFDEDGKKMIREVHGVFAKSPKAYHGEAAIEWWLSENGIQVPSTVGQTSVWVRYKWTKPELIGDNYSATATYEAGDQVYFNGDFYDALEDIAAGDTPTTHPDGWDKVEIPYSARNYLIRGAYADMLEHDRADVNNVGRADSLARQALDKELDGLYRRQGQVRQIQVRGR